MKIQIHSRKHGFTLVELLVTITIILILALIAFFAMRSVRESADMSVSMGRIRTLGLANLSYASDNNGKFASVTRTPVPAPTGEPFWHLNPGFLSYAVADAAYRDGNPSSGAVATPSPDSLLDPVVVKAKKAQWNRVQASYGYNQQGLKEDGWPSGSGPGIDKRALVAKVAEPTSSAMFFTARDSNVRYADRFRWKTDPSEGFQSGGGIAFRHKNRCLVVFYDGHTRAMTMEEIDRQGGISSHFWDADGPWN